MIQPTVRLNTMKPHGACLQKCTLSLSCRFTIEALLQWVPGAHYTVAWSFINFRISLFGTRMTRAFRRTAFNLPRFIRFKTGCDVLDLYPSSLEASIGVSISSESVSSSQKLFTGSVFFIMLYRV